MLLAVLAALPACCSSSDESRNPDPQGGKGGTPVYDYAGPPIAADVELEGSTRVLRVDVTVPSGGFEFEAEGVESQGGVAIVRLKLTQPGDDEIVTMALETHTRRVAIPQDARSFKVMVASWKRGVQYVVAPAHKLAKLVLSK